MQQRSRRIIKRRMFPLSKRLTIYAKPPSSFESCAQRPFAASISRAAVSTALRVLIFRTIYLKTFAVYSPML